MFKFFNEASGELEHVVWPTPNENKKYMMYTIGVIVTIGLGLALLGFFVTNGLSLARAQFPHDPIAITGSGEEDPMTQEDINKLLKDIKVDATTTTGSTNSGTTSASGSK